MKEYTIDISVVDSARDFHRLLAQALDFPEWYGHNLDALYDCLTELPEPVCLTLTGWDDTAPFAAGFRSVFEDAQADNPDFTLICE